MTAPALILHALTYVREAKVDRVTRYMALEWGVPPRTTRNALSRLCRQGKVVRVASRTYRIGESAEADELNTNPLRLGTSRKGRLTLMDSISDRTVNA